MAKKLDQDDDNNDLEVLHPERQLTLGGRQVTVREYGFVESLRLRPLMQPFLTDLHDVVAAGSDMPLDAIFDIITRHLDDVLQLVAIAADLDRDVIEALPSAEGELLLMAWWGVNGPFFSRQLQTRLLSDKVQARSRKSKASAGATSTPSSSPPDTTPPASETTQKDS